MKRVLLVGLVIALSGCQSQDMNDLKAYVDEVKARPPSGISPAPEPIEVETFVYVADERRDPFTLPEIAQEESEPVVDNGIGPDPNRRKEELEFHDLDSLRMVGTLQQEGGTWGLVQTKDGTIHRVNTGNHLGRNHGRITVISEDKIQLVELVQLGRGYQEKEAALALSVEGQ